MTQGVQVAGVVLTLPGWTPYLAVGVASLAGASYAAKRGFDAVGVCTLSVATGLGGLLLRAILLQQGTPVVLEDSLYLIIAALCAVIGFFFAGLITQFAPVMVILDGLATGFLCTAGASSALAIGLAPTSALFIGFVTAVGGLLLRDVLSGTAPQMVRPGSFLTVAALLSTGTFVTLVVSGIHSAPAQIIAMVVSLALRAGAHWLGWHTGSAADLSDRVWTYWYRGSRKIVNVTVKQSTELFDKASGGKD